MTVEWMHWFFLIQQLRVHHSISLDWTARKKGKDGLIRPGKLTLLTPIIFHWLRSGRWQSLIWAQLNIYYCNKNADRTGILLFTRFLHQSTFFHYWLKKKKHVYIEGWKRNWSFMYSLIVDQSEIFFYSIIQRCRQEITTMTLTEPSNASSSPSSSSGSHDSRGSIHLGINEQVILSGY